MPSLVDDTVHSSRNGTIHETSNAVANGVSNGTTNGTSNGTANGTPNGSANGTTNGTTSEAYNGTNGATSNGVATLVDASFQEDLPLRTSTPSVKRYPKSGISILVVGAGVGGLLAALECWRKGHDVRVLEKSSTHVMTGLWFSIEVNPTC